MPIHLHRGNLDHVVTKHTSTAVYKAPNPIVDSVQISAALTSHSEVSFLISSAPWSSYPVSALMRFGCFLKFLGLVSGRLATLCIGTPGLSAHIVPLRWQACDRRVYP